MEIKSGIIERNYWIACLRKAGITRRINFSNYPRLILLRLFIIIIIIIYFA